MTSNGHNQDVESGNDDDTRQPDFTPNGKFAQGNSYAAKPGEVRNPAGKTGPSIAQRLIKLADETRGGKKLADAMAEVAYKHALKGDFRFFQMILERCDGKVADKLEAQLRSIEVEYVDKGDEVQE